MIAANSITIDPEVQGGTPCFTGTRVPIKALFDAVKRGRSLEYFLEQYPSVKKEYAQDVLRQAEALIEASARNHSAV